MSTKKCKIFSSDFKAKVALEAFRSNKTLNEIASEFGFHPVQVGNWKKKLQERAASLFEIKRGPKPLDPVTDPKKLYSAIGRQRLRWTG